MKVVVGSPGTVSGLLLRTGQCLFAGSSIAVMVSASGFSSYTAFCYLVASMGLQALWSLGLGCLDVYALKMKRDLHNPVLVSLFVVGDWHSRVKQTLMLEDFSCVGSVLVVATMAAFEVTATLSLAAACSSGGVSVLFSRDADFCSAYPQLSCKKYEISVVFAFTTWLFIAMSSLVMFWLLASV